MQKMFILSWDNLIILFDYYFTFLKIEFYYYLHILKQLQIEIQIWGEFNDSV